MAMAAQACHQQLRGLEPFAVAVAVAAKPMVLVATQLADLVVVEKVTILVGQILD
jgi:hypothetical protein